MIVRIKHTWYYDCRYNLDCPVDREIFLNDLRSVVNFSNTALVVKVAGDAGDKP